MLFEDRIFYHIYPLGLCGAPERNDSAPLFQEEEGPFFAVGEEWAEHIKNLGCNAVYIGPLFESVGHGYETTDYKKVDIRLGSNHDFKEYVQYK